jgi:CHAT domain-containing protein/Tfp pilus assembly protein PilF
MRLLQSKGLVRRILSLGVVFGALILGSKPSEGSQPTPRPAAAKKVPSPPPQPARREFLNFQGWSGDLSLAKDEVHVYLFDLQPDDFVDIEVEQKGLDVEAKILAPGAQPSIKVDRLNDKSGPENIHLLADGAGRYRVELTGEGDGAYQILVRPKRKANTRDRENAAGALAYFRGMELKAGKKREAEQEFRKALASWEASGFREGQADAARQLGKLIGGRAANGEAVPFLDKAAILYHELRNLQQEVVVLQALGTAHKALGNNDQALTHCYKALALAYTLKDPKIEADILANRGGLYSEAGEFEKALKDLDRAVQIRRTLPNSVDLAQTLNVLGRAYYVQNELEMALSLHREALAILRDHPDGYVAGQTFVHLGDVYRKKGDFKRATNRYLQALTRLQGSHPREEAIALNNLALTYLEVGLYPQALSALQHCLQVFEAESDTDSVANVWTNMGWVLSSMKRYGEAFDAYGRALVTSRGKKRPFLEMASNYGMAKTEWQRGNLVTAKGFLEKSLAAMESTRTKAAGADLRSSFLAGKQEIYDLLVEILMGQHRLDPTKEYDLKAFEASEKSRSRRLLEDLEGRLVVPALSVQDVQSQVLGGDAVLLEYFLGDKRSYLWVVTASSFASYELPASRAQIEELAQEVHDLLGVSNKVEKRKIAIRRSIDLSRLLFGQVAGRLEGKKLLIVAPPELQYIAFGTLPEDLRESPRRGTAWPRPWTFDHEITVELSATVLAALRRLNEDQEPLPGLIAIFADPVYSLDDERMGTKRVHSQPGKQPRFPRLRFSRREVQAIETVVAEAGLGNTRRLVTTDFEANRQRVLGSDLKEFRYLHFSTHGELDARNSDRSAIVFSLVDREGKAIEGFLRAGEIAKLELPADLVVLSACQTGLGRKIRGEGLVGLTQAFFTAGASRVMVSLWDVDDQATARLMSNFYQKLLQEHLSPAAALKEAQVWMWRQPRWNAPYYWGGFVLQGERK